MVYFVNPFVLVKRPRLKAFEKRFLTYSQLWRSSCIRRPHFKADRRWVQVTSAKAAPSGETWKEKKNSPLLGKSTIGFLKEAANRSEVWSAALTENYGSGEDKLLTRLHRVQNLLQHWEDTVCHLHNIMQFYPYAIQADLKWQSLCNSCSFFSAHWCWTSLSHNAMASPSTLHHQHLHL